MKWHGCSYWHPLTKSSFQIKIGITLLGNRYFSRFKSTYCLVTNNCIVFFVAVLSMKVSNIYQQAKRGRHYYLHHSFFVVKRVPVEIWTMWTHIRPNWTTHPLLLRGGAFLPMYATKSGFTQAIRKMYEMEAHVKVKTDAFKINSVEPVPNCTCTQGPQRRRRSGLHFLVTKNVGMSIYAFVYIIIKYILSQLIVSWLWKYLINY